MVNAEYAIPNPLFDITNVRQRLYRGFKRNPNEIEKTIKLFNAHKNELYELFERNEYLNDKEKKNAVKYLNSFYKIINDPKLSRREFVENARTK